MDFAREIKPVIRQYHKHQPCICNMTDIINKKYTNLTELQKDIDCKKDYPISQKIMQNSAGITVHVMLSEHIGHVDMMSVSGYKDRRIEPRQHQFP